MARRLTTEIFIERAVALHGDKYDYSLVEYKNYSTKVPVICKSCSQELGQQYIFYVMPLNHLRKDKPRGCPRCGRRNGAKNRSLNTETFIERAKKIFPEYDYSRVEYMGYRTHVTIGCPEHGFFEVLPGNLLSYKSGCPICSRERRKHGKNKYNVYDTESFINKAVEVHGDKYDYRLVNYVSLNRKVDIISKKCSDQLGKEYIFGVLPSNFLRGSNCPRCTNHVVPTVSDVNERLREIHDGKIVFVGDKIIRTHDKGKF